MVDRDTHPNSASNVSQPTVKGCWSPLPGAVRTVAAGALNEWFDDGSGVARSVALATVGPMGLTSGFVGRLAAGATNSWVLLWSLSKTALSAALFRLIDLGRLTQDARVIHLLPDAPIDPAATVGQLLSHTAGVPDYGSWPDYHEAVRQRPDTPWPLEAYLERARSTGPIGPPGGQWAYSNVGYLMVRQIIEALTGLPLSEALSRLVFAPLGLDRTSVVLTPDDSGRLLFDGLDDGRSGPKPAAYHPGWVAHGVVRSTIEETAILFDRILGGRLLAPESLAGMTTPVIHVADQTSLGRLDWGHGVLLGTGLPVGDVIGHTGAGPGSTTAALRIIDRSGNAITIATAIDDEREHEAAELAMRVAAVIFDLTEYRV